MLRCSALSARLLSAAVLALLGACSANGYQMVSAPSQEVELTDSSLCRVYIARGTQWFGQFRIVKVYDGDREIGAIGPHEYLCWERPPGRRLGRLLYKGPKLDEQSDEGIADFTLEAGKVYYFEIHISEDFKQPVARQLKPIEGRKLIKDRKLAKS